MRQYFRTDSSICIFLSTAFTLTVSVKKYEIAAYIRNVWGRTEILPKLPLTSQALGVSSQKSSIFKSPKSVCRVTD